MSLINREALLAEYDRVHVGEPGKARKLIEDAPTIEPERKRGKWIIYKAPDKYHCGLCKCPFCGEEMIAEFDEYNFCPNCGADMREDTDDQSK